MPEQNFIEASVLITVKSRLLTRVTNSKSIFGQKVTRSDAASGWAGWALAPLEFGSSVNPITTMGADYAPHSTASPPRFEKPAASLPIATI